jgi:hypothetical protein
MRQVHNWSQDRESGVLAAFDIRKPRSTRKLKEGKKSRVYKRRMCLVVNCNSVVKKIHNHLTDVHKLTRKSKIYWHCVKSAIVYKPQVNLTESSDDESEDESDNESLKKSSKASSAPKSTTVYKKVYCSDESSGDEDEHPSCDDPSQDEEFAENSDGDGGLSDDEFKDGNTESASFNLTGGDGLLKKFDQWLNRPNGGRKESKCATHCVRQVQLILRYINPDNLSIKNILSKNTLRENWLTKVEKEKKPGNCQIVSRSPQSVLYVFKRRMH